MPIGSVLGVATAPKTVMPMIMARHQPSIRRPLRMPVKFSRISSSGSSNASPKTTIMRASRSRKSSSGRRLLAPPGVKSSRTLALVGRILYAKKAPPTNSGTPRPTKKSPYFFSLRCRPGARNAHSWYSQIGVARTRPVVKETFSMIVNGDSRPFTVKYAHCLLAPLLVSWDSRAPPGQPTESRTGFIRKSTMSL
jgi:hypothetical protein